MLFEMLNYRLKSDIVSSAVSLHSLKAYFRLPAAINMRVFVCVCVMSIAIIFTVLTMITLRQFSVFENVQNSQLLALHRLAEAIINTIFFHRKVH